MTSLREQVAFAISHGNMTQSNVEETAADLIGALAMADPLGAALWRVTGTLDPTALRRAWSILFNELVTRHGNMTKAVLNRLAIVVLEEWMTVLCPDCLGRGAVVREGVRYKCSTCAGSGRGVYAVAVRAERIGIPEGKYQLWAPVFEEAHGIVNASDRMVANQIAAQLERKSLKKKGKKDGAPDVV